MKKTVYIPLFLCLQSVNIVLKGAANLKKGIQTKLSRKIGKSRSLVSLILNGDRRPSWETAQKISEVTGSPVDIWMAGDLSKMNEVLNEWKPE